MTGAAICSSCGQNLPIVLPHHSWLNDSCIAWEDELPAGTEYRPIETYSAVWVAGATTLPARRAVVVVRWHDGTLPVSPWHEDNQ